MIPQSELPLIIWIISDGKPGHLNQSRGLAEALARATPARIHVLPAVSAARALLAGVFCRDLWPDAPAPDLILAAGHATHLSLLAARRARGGRAVVLMKPSLPRRWFELTVVPQHDGLQADAATLVTTGALNRLHPPAEHPNSRGEQALILIGGPSPHFEWHDDAIQLQIKSLLARSPNLRWTLTTSRRTPESFLATLPAHPALTVVPHTATSPDWLPEQLAGSGLVWVSPDSASMVYEALTAGADVGVFDLPVNPKSRVGRAIADLADTQRVTRFIQWCADGTLHPNTTPLAEADRCAAWILAWLKTGN